MTTLTDRTRQLLVTAEQGLTGTPAAQELYAAVAELDRPLRIAVVGRVKAGKSTLVNALVGEPVAATDARECTRLVTWYSAGVATRTWAHLADGTRRQLPFTRAGDATSVDLSGVDVDVVQRLEVETPNSRLADLTLIDTPGVGSTDRAVAARARGLLASTDAAIRPDGLVYLVRHLHDTDDDLLEAFTDPAAREATPAQAIAVLSRADEIGAGRADALDLASDAASRLRATPTLHGLVSAVVPVAGLLGYTAATLTEEDFAALAAVARMPAEEVLSVDRFGRGSVERRELLDRFGMFGVRHAARLIAEGVVADASALADRLGRDSGLDRLRSVVAQRFGSRASVLKCQTALRTLDRVLRSADAPGIRREYERLLVGAHEFTELRVIDQAAAGELDLSAEDSVDLMRVLGAEGADPATRLGLEDGAVREVALAQLERWRIVADDFLLGGATRDAAAAAARSCEWLLHSSPAAAESARPQP